MHYYWGKVLVHALPQPAWPLAWAAIRATAAAGVMGAAALALGRWRLPARDLPKVAGLACFGIVVNQVLFITGLKYTTPTQSALINTVIPVATLALSCLLGHEKATWRKSAGIALALGGAAWLLVPRATGEELHWRGNALCFANAISFSLFLALSRPFMRRSESVAATAWLFVFGAVGIDLVACRGLGGLPLGTVPPRIWVWGTCIVLLCTVLPFFLNNWALRRAPASTVAASIYLQPLIAASTSAAWLGERLGWGVGIAALLIFGGVALGTFGSGSSPRPAP
jgi:drug/metabolite transporter (DMT)-like permease